jgi:hypothetical protein
VEFSTIVLIGIVVLLTGISKSAFAGALGVFAVPLLMLKLPVTQAITLMLPILIIADVMSVKSFWKKWDAALLGQLIPGAVVGIIAATFLLDTINTNLIGLFVALICLLFAVKNLFFKNIELAFLKKPTGAYLMSSTSGVTSTLVHAGGPPLIMYFTAIGLTPTKFIATTAAFFAIMNIVKLIGVVSLGLLSLDTWLVALAFTPLAVLGNWLGVKIYSKFNKALFLTVMNYLLMILGLWLAVSHANLLFA